MQTLSHVNRNILLFRIWNSYTNPKACFNTLLLSYQFSRNVFKTKDIESHQFNFISGESIKKCSLPYLKLQYIPTKHSKLMNKCNLFFMKNLRENILYCTWSFNNIYWQSTLWSKKKCDFPLYTAHINALEIRKNDSFFRHGHFCFNYFLNNMRQF